MVLLHLGTLILLASVHCQPHKRQADGDDMPGEPENECCDQKMVGDDRYFNIGYDHNGMTMDLNCLSPCIFEKEDQPGSKYCFAAGDMKVECEDDMEFTPTGGPRPTEGEGEEGPDGDNNGVTGGPNGGENGVTGDGGDNNGGVTGDGVGSCQCGMKKSRRIIGGSETEVNEYPWMVVFADKAGDKQGGCGATLISDRWVVTAAHCFFDTSGNRKILEDDLSLVIGLHDRTVDTDQLRQVLTVSEIVLHPDYDWDSSANDIALVKLERDVDLNKYSPACLPEQGQKFTGQLGWVYGWGVTNFGDTAEDFPEKLLEVEVPIVSDEVCKEALLGLATILPGMLCAGGVANEDACGGDSGGPFTVEVGGKHTLAGAVSFGIGCGREGLYGVYAEVGDYRNWIDTTISSNGGATFCNKLSNQNIAKPWGV